MINFKNIFFGILCVVFLFSCSTTKTIDTNNDIVLKEVKKKYAPDLRVTIFYVKGLKKGKNIVLKGETNIVEAKNQVIEEFSKLKMNITDSIKLLPGIELKEKFAVVRLSVANLRTRPEHSAEMATQAIMGTPLRIFRNENGWSQVQTPDNYIAWVDNSGIESMNEAEKSKWLKMPKVIAIVQNGFINESDDLISRPVSDFVIGNVLGLKGESLDKNSWIVSFPDNRIGYVNKSAFRKLDEFFEEKSDINGTDIINSSFQFMGAPYLWGGTSSKGMDCSGFTKTVFFINGYNNTARCVSTGTCW